MRKAIGIITAAGLLAAIVTLGALGQEKEKKHTTSSGLEYIDHVVGTGDVAKSGMKVMVNYTGWLYVKSQRGKQFDTSEGKQPFIFKLGEGQVIQGWDEGVEGMKVGGKRELIVSPSLGYKSAGDPAHGIPPSATLDFEIELLKVAK